MSEWTKQPTKDELKAYIVAELKARGCRITKQRLLLLDIILQNSCASCKELYYQASAIDSSIGTATVYRMVKLLEDIGAINRRNMYRISKDENEGTEDTGSEPAPKGLCTITFDDNTGLQLSVDSLTRILQDGLITHGYNIGHKSIVSVNLPEA